MSDREKTDINKEIFFRLFKILHLAQHENKPADFGELTLAQLNCLRVIAFGKASMKEVAEEMKVTFPSATAAVNKLAELNLVKRETDKKDRRLIRVSLTNKGERILKGAMREKIISIANAFDKISAQEKKTLLKILQKVSGES